MDHYRCRLDVVCCRDSTCCLLWNRSECLQDLYDNFVAIELWWDVWSYSFGNILLRPGGFGIYPPGTRRFWGRTFRDMEVPRCWTALPVCFCSFRLLYASPWVSHSQPFLDVPRGVTLSSSAPAFLVVVSSSEVYQGTRPGKAVVTWSEAGALVATWPNGEHNVSVCFSEHGGTLLMSWRSLPEPVSRVVDVLQRVEEEGLLGMESCLGSCGIVSSGHGRLGSLSLGSRETPSCPSWYLIKGRFPFIIRQDKSLGLEAGGRTHTWRQGPRPGGRNPDPGVGTQNLGAGTRNLEAGIRKLECWSTTWSSWRHLGAFGAQNKCLKRSMDEQHTRATSLVRRREVAVTHIPERPGQSDMERSLAFLS
ncbi:hypothetical protein F2Q69_00037699 [Brassica cretica]|uniref:Uncharacterized protein n=1 Tax=Brassica cretica TaxID=69181 RepID=A0A8S9SH92_BRACR|nr:hypothetical protein F2Q69_00037699 [Brassica cretica]